MMVHESAHMQTARKELEALRTSHDASLLLHDVLAGLSGPAEDWATPRGRQKIAVGFLSANLASIFAGRHGDNRLGLRAGGDGTQAPDR
jgi:hypothetical protein